MFTLDIWGNIVPLLDVREIVMVIAEENMSVLVWVNFFRESQCHHEYVVTGGWYPRCEIGCVFRILKQKKGVEALNSTFFSLMQTYITLFSSVASDYSIIICFWEIIDSW